MRTLTRSTRLASILLPAFLYLGCTGEGLTGPNVVDEADVEPGSERIPPDGAAAADQCIHWEEEMFCPNTGNPFGENEAK